MITAGNVFANNGSGPDSDPDSGAFLVTAVSGGTVGTQLTLPSGALLTLNADGTFSYDPNHLFDYLPTPGSGASNLTITDTFSYTITGGDTATVTVTVSGVDTNDVLYDSAGIDSLAGGIGNDVYYVNNTGDVVTEAANAGFDTVAASVNYTLPANNTVEVLNMLGSGLTGTGTDGAETFISSSGPNTLIGLGGNDTYYVNNTGDVVIEAANGGIDTVEATVDYTLPASNNVEALYMLGSGLTGTGSGGAETLLQQRRAQHAGRARRRRSLLRQQRRRRGDRSGGRRHRHRGSERRLHAAGQRRGALHDRLRLTGTGTGNADTLLSSGGPNTLVGLGGDDLYYVNNRRRRGDRSCERGFRFGARLVELYAAGQCRGAVHERLRADRHRQQRRQHAGHHRREHPGRRRRQRHLRVLRRQRQRRDRCRLQPRPGERVGFPGVQRLRHRGAGRDLHADRHHRPVADPLRPRCPQRGHYAREPRRAACRGFLLRVRARAFPIPVFRK